MALQSKEVTEVKESFGQKLINKWPVYLMEGVVWAILAAIAYLIIFM
ncbi:MAG: hypothetical protein V1773_00075 [bacterium]